jgi:hypothetical protein
VRWCLGAKINFFYRAIRCDGLGTLGAFSPALTLGEISLGGEREGVRRIIQKLHKHMLVESDNMVGVF